jgi:hypothetical protein
MMTDTWRSQACKCLVAAAQSFPNIASIYADTFFAPCHSTQCVAIPRPIPSPSFTSSLDSKVTALGNRKSKISHMLRMLKQLDMTRVHLQAKIKENVNSINASYKRPLSNRDKNNIERNHSLLPLALAVQLKEAPPPRPPSTGKKKASRAPVAATALSPAASLEQEGAHLRDAKAQLARMMDHEGTYCRWLEKSLRENDQAGSSSSSSSSSRQEDRSSGGGGGQTELPPAELQLSKEIGKSVEMFVLLEDTVGIFYVNGKICTRNSPNPEEKEGRGEEEEEGGCSQGKKSLLPVIFERANHDMELAGGSSVLATPRDSCTDTSNESGDKTRGMPLVLTRTDALLAGGGQHATTSSSSSSSSSSVVSSHSSSRARASLWEQLLLGVAPPPLSCVDKEALDSLRAQHASMLGRAAQACDRYCPYEFAHT